MNRNIVDFPDRAVIEEEASEWIVRFEGDEPPGEADVAALQAWMAQSPTHREVLMRYASTWNDMDLLSELALPLSTIAAARARPFSRLRTWLLSPFVLLAVLFTGLRSPFTDHPGRAAVASVVVALGAVALFTSPLMPERQAENVYATAVGQSASHTLSDGSGILLNTNSRVEVDYSAERRRIVLEKGEVYFKVVKDPARPFEVYAGTRMVRAVGTAFSVYRENTSVKVTVTEGRVDLAVVKPTVTTHKKKTALAVTGKSDGRKNQNTHSGAPPDEAASDVLGSLVAGQSVVMDASRDGAVEDVINHEREEIARSLSWREGLLVFAGEPLDQVVAEVSRYTPVKITIADPELKKLRIGGQFQTGRTEALFDVLRSGFGLRISRQDDRHVEIHAGDD